MKTIWILLSLIFALFNGSFTLAAATPLELVILHTGDTVGFVDPCG